MAETKPEKPHISFPYLPPDKDLRDKYREIFSMDTEVKPRILKRLFDLVFSILVLLVAIPVLLLIWAAYKIEGMILPQNAGPVLFYYNAVSAGKIIRKYKIRIIRQSCIDPELVAKNDWHAYQNEWNPACRTFTGAFVKKFYLDELPQFFSVLKGDMSVVGPRPLAVHHYQRDLNQGNIARKLLRGGILGLGHIRKGTSQMGDPRFEYEYIDAMQKLGPLPAFGLDIWIIWRGLLVVFKGGGL
ncbi:MAG: sugar transferase [Rhodobacteraceae bacterium]|nr:sugar transferase [Paracoccaceae bacterium]